MSFPTDQELRGMPAYTSQDAHLSTEKMVHVLAQIHMHGTDGNRMSGASIAKSIQNLLEEKVAHSETGKTFATALDDLKNEIDQGNALGNVPGSLKDSALTVIRGIEMKLAAEPALHQELSRHQAFQSFNPSESWRLVMDRYQQENRGEYGFENESGYMSGTFNGLREAMASVGQPLTVNTLTHLHDTCVDNIIPMGKTIEQPGVLETGLRDTYDLKGDERRVGFGLTQDRNMSAAGLQELQDKINVQGDNWFEIQNINGANRLMTFPKSTQECNDRAQGIIDQYNTDIGLANTADEKYAAIAQCCRDLEISHVYADGNARTIGFCLANKLLAENDLPPVILENPNRFDGYSVDELVTEMKSGAVNFAGYCNGPVITADFPTPEAATLNMLQMAKDLGKENELLIQAGKSGNSTLITASLNERRAVNDQITPGDFDYQAEMAVAHARHPNSEAGKNDYKNVNVANLNVDQARDLVQKAMVYSHDRLSNDQTGKQSRAEGWTRLLDQMRNQPAVMADQKLMDMINLTEQGLSHMNSNNVAVRDTFRNAAKNMDAAAESQKETTSLSGKVRSMFRANTPAAAPADGVRYVPGKGMT